MPQAAATCAAHWGGLAAIRGWDDGERGVEAEQEDVGGGERGRQQRRRTERAERWAAGGRKVRGTVFFFLVTTHKLDAHTIGRHTCAAHTNKRLGDFATSVVRKTRKHPYVRVS